MMPSQCRSYFAGRRVFRGGRRKERCTARWTGNDVVECNRAMGNSLSTTFKRLEVGPEESPFLKRPTNLLRWQFRAETAAIEVKSELSLLSNTTPGKPRQRGDELLLQAGLPEQARKFMVDARNLIHPRLGRKGRLKNSLLIKRFCDVLG
jgi:hypothetical protein